MKENLDNGTIVSPENFKEDVRACLLRCVCGWKQADFLWLQVLLTFQNAMIYNPATHDVHVMAKALKELFISKWEPIESSVVEKWRLEQVCPLQKSGAAVRCVSPVYRLIPRRYVADLVNRLNLQPHVVPVSASRCV